MTRASLSEARSDSRPSRSSAHPSFHSSTFRFPDRATLPHRNELTPAPPARHRPGSGSKPARRSAAFGLCGSGGTWLNGKQVSHVVQRDCDKLMSHRKRFRCRAIERLHITLSAFPGTEFSAASNSRLVGLIGVMVWIPHQERKVRCGLTLVPSRNRKVFSGFILAPRSTGCRPV